MNVCYLTWEYPPEVNGGVAVYVYEIAKALKNIGHNVFIITKTIYQSKEGYEDGIYIIRVKSKKIKIFNFIRDILPRTVERLEFSIEVSKRLKTLTRKYNIDVVESCEAYSIGFWFYLLRQKPPLIIKLHTPEGIIYRWNGEENNLDVKLLTKMEEFWILRAKKIIAVTAAVNNLVSRFYRLKSRDLTVIHNPFSWSIEFDKRIIRDNFILYVGRLEFRKGVHILVRSIPKVLGEFPDANFIFIGADCGMKSYIESKIKEYNCRKNVEIINQVSRENLIRYYNEASLCVVPSLWENFPYACVEPMSLGKLVIASNTGGIPEIISDNETGVLFTPGSPVELAKKIIQFLPDNDFKKDIQDKARKHIKHLCNPTDIANRTIDIYQKLIKC